MIKLDIFVHTFPSRIYALGLKKILLKCALEAPPSRGSDVFRIGCVFSLIHIFPFSMSIMKNNYSLLI